MDVVGIVANVVVGLVLVAAGVSKLRTRTWGVLALEMGTPRVIVLTLPAFEVVLGLGLVLQLLPSVLPWVAVGVFAIFTIVVLQRYLSGSKAPCNCFGTSKEQDPVTLITVTRNVILLVLSIVGAIL